VIKIKKVFESNNDYYFEISEHDFYDDDFDEGKYNPLTDREMKHLQKKF
jgi:hypothetical protein